jgi:hypothetical protein
MVPVAHIIAGYYYIEMIPVAHIIAGYYYICYYNEGPE